MELILGIIFIFGGVGFIVNQDAEKQRIEREASTIVGKEIRFIQETRETTYKAETLGGWRKVQ
jgi:DNA-binding transcriptional regulator YhcF (GntR family)